MSLESAMTLTQQTDEQLLNLVSQQDIEAYEVLCDRHAQAVYSLIARIVRDIYVADELLQETFWLIWQNAGHYAGRSPAIAWMMRMARDRSLDHLRRQKTSAERELADINDRTENRPLSTVEAEQTWNRQQVRLALDSLPYEQRLCVELAYFEGMSQREIANSTTMAVETVRSRMRIGLEKLARILHGVGAREDEVSEDEA